MTTSISDLARQHAPAWARVTREVLDTPYPYASGHVATGPDDTDVTPQRLHPAFHGALDWHSSVHMQWSLLTLLDRYDAELAAAGEAEPALRMLCGRLTEARLAVEVDYLWSRPAFERPYGWAWAAMLVAAAYRSEREESTGWAIALEPLGEVVAQHTVDWLPRQAYPVRHGKHQNDAFALALMLDSFAEIGRDDVVEAIRARARDWFAHDTAHDTRTEPSGTDFLSPALCQAELMRRVLPEEEFRSWLAGFLPGLGQGEHAQLLGVPEVRDPADGQFVHLAGLGLSRAWQLRRLAPHLDSGAATVVLGAADKQVEAALPFITGGDFMATHWLVSFALLATGHER